MQIKFKLSKLQWAAVIIAVAILLFRLNPAWVERFYSNGLYKIVSKLLRLLFGFIPFSIGDVLYIAAAGFIIYAIVKTIRDLISKKFNLVKTLSNLMFAAIWGFNIFNINWGLNNYRLGVSHQFSLPAMKPNEKDLDTLTNVLIERVNALAPQHDTASIQNLTAINTLFDYCKKVYKNAETAYGFLAYNPPSVKPSLLGSAGNYFGFLGYYNPFSGEAQLNTTVPNVVKPFVCLHEIAHQLGYAKECEANFIAYIVCKNGNAPVFFRYATYLDLFMYAHGQLKQADSLKAKTAFNSLHQQAQKDILEIRNFYSSYNTYFGDFITSFYTLFLMANNQPSGMKSYDKVLEWLIAYYKKHGAEAL